MIEEIEIPQLPNLDDYSQVAQLTHAVQELRTEAAMLTKKLSGRRIWMLNSTAQGGGVAEMLPRLVTLLQELGADTHWLVMGTERQAFFGLTKHIHNLIHGAGDPQLSADDKSVYDTVSREVADELKKYVSPNDILVCHDPQPAGACALVKQEVGLPTVWRCHIGLDDTLPQTRTAWDFLQPYLEHYDHFVFTAPEYIPDYMTSNVSIIYPALDPFSHKNRDLFTHKMVGVMTNSSLVPEYQPVVTPPFDDPVLRLQANGEFSRATHPGDIGLLFRPVITQVSRWDNLKGWQPLLEGFVKMKKRARGGTKHPEREQRELELCRLVLGGPEPAAVKDDPEAVEVLENLIEAYKKLDHEDQEDIALLSLPMASRKNNALIVNALQRCSSVVVQNSLREGFGLTVAEAMWKRIAVLGSNACGIRQQIRHGIDGHINSAPDSPDAIADALEEMLVDHEKRQSYGSRAQRRVNDEFLVFEQAARWLRVLGASIDPPRHSQVPSL